MLSHPTSSNLAEALLKVRKMENHFIQHEFQFLDRDRNKIRAHVDRHKESFLQLTRKRHETWYRHDRHFREALRKENELHKKRVERNRQKLLLEAYPQSISQDYTLFQPITPHESTLPPINKTTPKAEPMTKVERHTYQVLRASQKLLDESAARPRYKFVLDRPSSTTFSQKPPQQSTAISGSIPGGISQASITTAPDDGAYDRLVNQSLQHGTFSEFVDHFVKFRPEFRERFGYIHEENQRQKTVDRVRASNQIHAKKKDERYQNLINSLIDRHSE